MNTTTNRYRVAYSDGTAVLVDAPTPEHARTMAYRVAGGRTIATLHRI